MTDKQEDLKPWSLRPLANLVVGAYGVFFAIIAVFMVYGVMTSGLNVIGKLGVVGLTSSILGFFWTFVMWRRYWCNVGWDLSFWDFISGPKPHDDYEDAVQAWRWGRRNITCWLVGVIAMAVTVLAAVIGG